jgi:nickel transport protein
MKSLLLVISSLAFVMLAAFACWSHGVEGYIEPTDGYCATALYDDGEPMSYAAVEIKAPDSDIGFQTGRTDRNGRFVFRPDRQGRWQVVVKDGMGHRLPLDLKIGAGGNAPELVDSSFPMTSEGMSRTAKVVSGLCIIFGLSGFLYGWKARRTIA